MTQMVPLLLILVLMGCSTPAPGFLSAPRQDVTVDGMRFAVFARGTEAQVIRLDRARRADRALIAGRMMRAVEQATGCTPITGSLAPQGGRGSAVALLDLRCPP